MTPARRIWQQIETVHAVTYFAAESHEAARLAGLRGFWMGYFGFRAAPLGAVEPAVVEATFANFSPTMVRRAIPDAWHFAEPSALVEARSTSAAAALRRVAADTDVDVGALAAELDEALGAVIARATAIGRPLFAANARLDAPDDPVRRLWQHCTTLREHRGDGHVAALATHGIDGCAAHLLIAAEHGWAPDVFFDHRGWTVEEQRAAAERLRARRLLGDDGLTSAGAALVAEIEALTDELAWAPYAAAGDAFDLDRVVATVGRLTAAVVVSGTIPFPNPMGLPDPTRPGSP